MSVQASIFVVGIGAVVVLAWILAEGFVDVIRVLRDIRDSLGAINGNLSFIRDDISSIKEDVQKLEFRSDPNTYQ